MARIIRNIIGILLAIAITATVSSAAETQYKKPASDGAEPSYMGKPLSYWVRCIRDRDEANMELAFDAIRELGPDSSAAVPELTRIVAEPFTPIEIGVDNRRAILSKIQSIRLRSDAVDALVAIGEPAASSTVTLIEWALTVRVVPRNIRNTADDEHYVDLVLTDVLERMRVAGAVAQFGPDAALAVTALLSSPDGERRKLGVAIMSERTLPIARPLLKSRNCEDRKLGIALLVDMWPVVAKEHLTGLKSTLVCDAN